MLTRLNASALRIESQTIILTMLHARRMEAVAMGDDRQVEAMTREVEVQTQQVAALERQYTALVLALARVEN